MNPIGVVPNHSLLLEPACSSDRQARISHIQCPTSGIKPIPCDVLVIYLSKPPRFAGANRAECAPLGVVADLRMNTEPLFPM